jgi:hypothetical protein
METLDVGKTPARRAPVRAPGRRLLVERAGKIVDEKKSSTLKSGGGEVAQGGTLSDHFFSRKGLRRSMGTGKMVVEFFSVATSVRV